MKKKILFFSLLLVASFASFQFSNKHENLNDLMLENIEALASDEWSTTLVCFGSGTVDCPLSHVKVYFVTEPYSLEERY